MKKKIPEVYGYAVMAHKSSPFHHMGQYAFFRLQRDAIEWRNKHYPPEERDEFNQIEVRNAVLRISII